MHLIVNGEPVHAEAATVADLVADLVGGLATGHAVALNHEVVPRGDLARRALREGDVVDVVTAVAGG